MISTHAREIQALVSDIRDGKLLLPELQRSYVWKSSQVAELFDSLYHQYPSGQLLVWETDDLPYSRTTQIDGVDQQRRPQLLLDGQQRLTSLAAILLGRELISRDSKRPIDIMFNVFTEKFEVAGPRNRGQSGWVSLSQLFTQGAIPIWIHLGLNNSDPEAQRVLSRLTNLEKIKEYKYQVNVLENLSYEEVTHIFVRVNSGGTKLSSADLTLAQVSSRWRGVTKEFERFRKPFIARGLEMDNGLLLRAIAVLLNDGQSRLSLLFRGRRQQTSSDELRLVWARVQPALDQAISFLATNCLIDRLELLPTEYVLIPLAMFFDRFGTDVSTESARGLQRWVYMALLWSRYSTSTETKLDQDVAALREEQPITRLIQNIESEVGRRPITERELRDQRKNSAYMLMSYVLARYAQAQDWFNGVVIGSGQKLELHHIFPKKLLREEYDLKTDSRTVDQVANLAFLSRRANTRISTKSPNEYLPDIAPQRLKAQSVPMDPNLWTLDRFQDFLLRRRESLAESINSLLNSLSEEPSLWPIGEAQTLKARIGVIEHDIRELAAARLLESHGDSAWAAVVPKDIRHSVERRLENRQAGHPYEGDLQTLFAKLELCQFSDYSKIVKATWNLFEDVFGNLEEFDRHFQAVTQARNALAHNREMNRVERASAEAGMMWLEDCFSAASLRSNAN